YFYVELTFLTQMYSSSTRFGNNKKYVFRTGRKDELEWFYIKIKTSEDHFGGFLNAPYLKSFL
ncbi:MAG TPA: hypothetical protein DIT95_01830, partial [Arenibacter sp.]|nr:hypothetical protein [Arenibacter sp.]